MLWRRCLDVLAVTSYLVPESFTQAIDKDEWPIAVLYELYFLGILYAAVIKTFIPTIVKSLMIATTL